MLPHLLLGLALTVGQADAPPKDGASKPRPEPLAVADSSTSSDRWALMTLLQGTAAGPWLDSRGVQISGWTDMSFTASSISGNILPYGFNYRGNEFLLQQNWLRIDRPVDTSGTDPSFGFRADTMLPGTDYRFTLARGLFSGQLTAINGQPNLYGIDPIQFYVEGYFPTVGPFLCPVRHRNERCPQQRPGLTLLHVRLEPVHPHRCARHVEAVGHMDRPGRNRTWL
jgi:hypothetical protein